MLPTTDDCLQTYLRKMRYPIENVKFREIGYVRQG